MLYLILSLVIQVILIVHCIKTGRNQIWIWVLALLSLPGAVAYIAVEMIPDVFRSRGAKRTAKSVKGLLDPGANLRQFESEMRVTGHVDSRQRYADELVNHGRYDDAIAEYRLALSGLYEHDPKLMLGVARAQFGKGDAAAARATLDELIKFNPDFRSPEGHLLYARALETEGNTEKALEEYKTLAPSYPGAEAAVRYARLLKNQGQRDAARTVARELLDEAKIAPPHYRRAQREWLDEAERLAG